MKYYWPILALALVSCQKQGPLLSVTGTPAPSSTKTFMVMGQSNMRGMAGGEFPAVPHVKTDALYNMGPGFVFGGLVAQHQGVEVNLINCSIDGSSLADWSLGGIGYQPCVDRIKGHKIDAIIYWQGEAESALDPSFPWAQKFHQLIATYRQIIGNVPVIYCQLGITTDFTTYPNFDHIKDEQAMAQGQGYYMVNTDTVPNPLATEDSVHYSHAAVQEVGQRIYQVYAGIE